MTRTFALEAFFTASLAAAAQASLPVETLVQFYPAVSFPAELMVCNSDLHVGPPYDNGNGEYVISDNCIFTLVPALNGDQAPSFSIASNWDAPGDLAFYLAPCGRRPDGRSFVCAETPSPDKADLMTWGFVPGLSNASMWSLQNAASDEYLVFLQDPSVAPCDHGYWDAVAANATAIPSPEAATWDLKFFAPQPVMGATYALAQAAAPSSPLRICNLTAVVCASDCATANASDYVFQVVSALDGSSAPYVSFASVAFPGYFLLPQYDAVAPLYTVVEIAKATPSLHAYATWLLYPSRVDPSGWSLYSPIASQWLGMTDAGLTSCSALAPVNDVIAFGLGPSSIWTLVPVEFSMSPSPLPSSAASTSHWVSVARIAGITVACIAVLFVAILGAVIWRRHRAQRSTGKVAPAPAIALTNFSSLRIAASSADSKGDVLDSTRHAMVRPLLGMLDRRHSVG